MKKSRSRLRGKAPRTASAGESQLKCLSIVVSVYNEEQGLEQFYQTTSEIVGRLCRARAQTAEPLSYELFFVNDGSTDRSGEILEALAKRDRAHVSVLTFSRNFGHEAAMTAGLDYASGEYLVFMDADLQHPPQCIGEILAQFDAGYDIVSMVRTKNETAGLVKNLASGAFYRLVNCLSAMRFEPGASDFFAIDRRVADVLRRSFREKVRFLRGYVQNIGFRKTTLCYEAAPRVAGSSHYSLRKLWRFSVDTIICFSNLPLKLGIYAGFLSGLLGVLLIVYTLFTRQSAPSGYATIVIVLCFMFAVLFLLLGIIGSYLAILFNELKDRPIYITENLQRAEEAGKGITDSKQAD